MIKIDVDTRKWDIPKEEKILGVESDEKVKVLQFEISKNEYISGLNFTDSICYINFKNNSFVGQYGIIDMSEFEGKVTFTWEVSRSATRYKGDTYAILCAKKIREDGTIINEWNSTLGKFQVLEGIEPDKSTEEPPETDIIQKLINDVNKANQTANEALQKAEEALQNSGGGGIIDSIDASKVVQSENYRFVTDTEKQNWTDKTNQAISDSEEALQKANEAIDKVDSVQTGDSYYKGVVVAGERYNGVASFSGIKLHKVVGKAGLVIKNIFSYGTKQLFNQKDVPTTSKGGATVTNHNNGSFTISGNGNLTEELLAHASTTSSIVLKPGNLYLKVEQATTPYVYIDFYYDDDRWAFTIDSKGSNFVTKQITEDMANRVHRLHSYIRGKKGETIVPGTIKPMLYQDGDGTWEVYQHGNIKTNLVLNEGDVYENGVITKADGSREDFKILTCPSFYPKTDIFTDCKVTTDIEWKLLSDSDNTLKNEELEQRIETLEEKALGL